MSEGCLGSPFSFLFLNPRLYLQLRPARVAPQLDGRWKFLELKHLVDLRPAHANLTYYFLYRDEAIERLLANHWPFLPLRCVFFIPRWLVRCRLMKLARRCSVVASAPVMSDRRIAAVLVLDVVGMWYLVSHNRLLLNSTANDFCGAI